MVKKSILTLLSSTLLISCAVKSKQSQRQTEQTKKDCGSIISPYGPVVRPKLPVAYYVDSSVPEKYARDIYAAALLINRGMKRNIIVFTDFPLDDSISWIGSDWEALNPGMERSIAITDVHTVEHYIEKAPITMSSAHFIASSTQENILIMVHEFGHGLGFNHADEIDSIMYESQAPIDVINIDKFFDQIRCAYFR